MTAPSTFRPAPVAGRGRIAQRGMMGMLCLVEDPGVTREGTETVSRVRGEVGSRDERAADRVEDIFTLSPLQQGMLFHLLSDPEKGLYLEQTVCGFEANLDVMAFRQAWRQVVDRHGALRTGFLWQGLSKPVQVVKRQAEVEFQECDWRHFGEKEQEEKLAAFLDSDRRRGFDLSNPPLMRLTLIRRSEDSYRLVWTIAHLIMDAWCSSLVLEEVVRRYEANRAEVSPSLPQSRSYGRYIRWLKAQDPSGAESFWRRLLEGFHAPSKLMDRAHTDSWSGQDQGYQRLGLRLSERESTSLRDLARSHQLTLNTVVQGAWAILLARICQVDDIVYGTVVSGRSVALEGVESMVGLLINTLPQRVRMDRQQPLLNWLGDLQGQQVEMQEHEHTPLTKVQSWSEVASGDSLFEAIFVFLNVADPSRQETGSLGLEDLRYFGRPHYPLSLHVLPGQRLRLDLVFDGRRFRESTVNHWLELLGFLLRELPTRPFLALGGFLEMAEKFDRNFRRETRQRRRDSNSFRLRDTRPIKIQVQDSE